MSDPAPDDRQARMAQVVRDIVTQRERAPRSPRLERAFKRLIWRYTRRAGADPAEEPPQHRDAT